MDLGDFSCYAERCSGSARWPGIFPPAGTAAAPIAFAARKLAKIPRQPKVLKMLHGAQICQSVILPETKITTFIGIGLCHMALG